MNDELLEPEKVLRKCNKLRAVCEERRSELDGKKGERTGVLRDLKQRFGIPDMGGVRKRIQSLDMSITRRNKKVDETYRKLQEKYDF